MTTEFDDPLLSEWHNEIKQDAFAVHHAAEWYARVQAMRDRADYYERTLIRHLKYDLGLTWAQVAEVVNANLSSRQAAQAKWSRLIEAGRRTAGSPGRGGAPKGQQRQ